MNNGELYKETFSKLHASRALDLEGMSMNNMSKKNAGFRCRRSMIVLAAVMTVMMAMSAIAYAATGGEIVNTIKVWLNGQEVGVGEVVESQDGGFKIKIENADDNNVDLNIYDADDPAASSEEGDSQE